MRITVNGEPRDIAADSSIATLLQVMQLEPTRVAVEHNRQLVPRSLHAETRLQDGDTLEIVTLVGGG
ncbi:MAG: sulfur carrier protein ThiS [Phycisphaerae bacterium]